MIIYNHDYNAKLILKCNLKICTSMYMQIKEILTRNDLVQIYYNINANYRQFLH